MSCLGVTGKPMVVTYLARSGNPKDGLPCNMDVTSTTYYGKDFTRIVLELIGALEQRIRVVTIFQGKCIEIHVGYEKETRGINRCGDE